MSIELSSPSRVSAILLENVCNEEREIENDTFYRSVNATVTQVTTCVSKTMKAIEEAANNNCGW
jgi:hypothetical protein